MGWRQKIGLSNSKGERLPNKTGERTRITGKMRARDKDNYRQRLIILCPGQLSRTCNSSVLVRKLKEYLNPVENVLPVTNIENLAKISRGLSLSAPRCIEIEVPSDSQIHPFCRLTRQAC